MSKDAMFISAISALVAVIVWLALYIRKMHQKTIEYLNEDKEKMIEVISKNTASAEGQARSSDRLAQAVNDLNKTILTRKSE